MIRAITQTKPVSLKRQRDLMEQSTYAMNRVARVIVTRERKAFIDAIDKPVRPSPRLFVWSEDKAANNRARRWYFWAISTGLIPTEGGRYKRSGKMKKSAFVDANLKQLEGLISMGFRGDGSKGAEYVYGLKQIPGHSAYPRLVTLAEKSATRQSKQFNIFWRVYNNTGNIGKAIADSAEGAA